VIFKGKLLSKQAEIISDCGKGQGQHMEKKSGKKISHFFGNFFRGLSFYGADCTSVLGKSGQHLFSSACRPASCNPPEFFCY
jgi:hypothetical protein